MSILNEYYAPLLFIIILIIVVIIFDSLASLYYKRTGKSSSYFIEVMRKGTHTTGGMMFGFAPYFGIATIDKYIILLIALLILTLNEQKLFMFKKMRPGALKYTWGFCLATVPLIYYQYYLLFTISCAIYAIPDSLAALVGRAIGKPIKLIGGKSIAGFLAYAISAAIVLNFSHISIIYAITLALILAIVELFAKGGSDNFLCPTLTIVILYALGVR